jgi:hypothetical protein
VGVMPGVVPAFLLKIILMENLSQKMADKILKQQNSENQSSLNL